MSESYVGRSPVNYIDWAELSRGFAHNIICCIGPASSGKMLKHVKKSSENYEKIASREQG